MTTPNPMRAELDAVVRLIAEAKAGHWMAGHAGSANLVAFNGEDVTGLASVNHRPNLEAMAAAVNFLRTHHATLADMAKRLEAAERDARRWRFLRAEIALGRPGAFGAMNAAIPDDAPETKEVIEGCLDSGIDAAIAATQEGEG